MKKSMLKKMISILLCMAMLAGLGAAAAEADKTELGSVNVNGKFTLKARLPEGYTVQLRTIDSDKGFLQAGITSQDPTKPVLDLTIAFEDTDLCQLERLNDATEEQKRELEKTFVLESKVDFSYSQTGLGAELLIVKEAEGTTDFVVIFAIYKGYDVEFVMFPGEAATEQGLTEEQIQMCIDLMTDMDFVEN